MPSAAAWLASLPPGAEKQLWGGNGGVLDLCSPWQLLWEMFWPPQDLSDAGTEVVPPCMGRRQRRGWGSGVPACLPAIARGALGLCPGRLLGSRGSMQTLVHCRLNSGILCFGQLRGLCSWGDLATQCLCGGIWNWLCYLQQLLRTHHLPTCPFSCSARSTGGLHGSISLTTTKGTGNCRWEGTEGHAPGHHL